MISKLELLKLWHLTEKFPEVFVKIFPEVNELVGLENQFLQSWRLRSGRKCHKIFKMTNNNKSLSVVVKKTNRMSQLSA
jgi:hypothetical protein